MVDVHDEASSQQRLGGGESTNIWVLFFVTEKRQIDDTEGRVNTRVHVAQTRHTGDNRKPSTVRLRCQCVRGGTED